MNDDSMHDDPAAGREPAGGQPAEGRGLESRRTRRLPIHGVLVAIDAPEIAPHPWVVDAIDINAGGMGIVLPPELPEGASVLLSFRLADDIELSRVPARVQHRDGASGGVRFEPWGPDDRLQLLEFLVSAYEHER